MCILSAAKSKQRFSKYESWILMVGINSPFFNFFLRQINSPFWNKQRIVLIWEAAFHHRKFKEQTHVISNSSDHSTIVCRLQSPSSVKFRPHTQTHFSFIHIILSFFLSHSPQEKEKKKNPILIEWSENQMPGLTAPFDYSQEPPRHPTLLVNSKVCPFLKLLIIC